MFLALMSNFGKQFPNFHAIFPAHKTVRIRGENQMSDNTQTNPFTSHPHAVGESYTEHFGVAMSYSWRMLKASFCAFTHAFLPFAFEKTASAMVRQMVADMDKRTPHAQPPGIQPAE
jgi:Family of unknown function (DUF6356)